HHMSSEIPDHFFLLLRLKDGDIRGHGAVWNVDDIQVAEKPASEKTTEAKPVVADAKTLHDVFNAFDAVISTYRSYISLTMAIAPQVSVAIAERTMKSFANSKGKLRPDLSSDKLQVFETPISAFREFLVRHAQTQSAIEGAKLLPEVMLIG